MASPQKENGYAPVANEILEALYKSRVFDYRTRFLFYLFRNTYGKPRNPKSFEASFSEISMQTGILRQHLHRAVESLRASKVLPSKVTGGGVTSKGNTCKNTYSLQKDFDRWVLPLKVTVTSKGNTSVTSKGNTPRTRVRIRQTRQEKNVFAPPSLEEVTAYCQERKNTVNPSTFIDFYASKGWFVGKNKMRDWRAAVRTWEAKRQEEIRATIGSDWRNQ